ncbi:MAG: hypothetical protein J6Y89_03875 [Lachnospiraceae bacterium]|nr:hypothetical protein [Lachnospiraceae bacterium]
MNRKRILTLILLMVMVSMVACGPAKAPDDTAESYETAETAASASLSSDSSEDTASSATTPEPADDTSSVASTSEADGVLSVNPNSGVYPPEVSLSGNREDHLLTDELCCIEGDKFFLIVSEGADIPGDFADNVSLIMDRMEKETGLTFDVGRHLADVDNSSFDYGYDPWEGFDFKDKLQIYIKVDPEDVGYISCASAEFVTLYMYELYSLDVWNAVPSYRDNPWRRRDCIDYYTVAHELTHALTLRYAKYGDILTEGCADYVAEKVISSLSSVSSDFEGSVEIMSNNLVYSVKADVTSENAEEIFRNDYSDLSHADRGDEYTLGRMICSFLCDTYGENFLKDYTNACIKAGYSYERFWGDLNETDLNRLADVFKETFGDDVFVNFGKYYKAHKK